MKTITSLLFCCLLVLATPLQAKVRSVIDWDGGENPYRESNMSVTGHALRTACAEACPPPYSLTLTRCPQGQVLESCKASGCGYYNQCRPRNSTDKEEQPADDVSLQELLEEIENFDKPQDQY